MTDIVKNKELQKELSSKVKEMILDKMQDIEGIDEISFWPLAPGWWAIIIIVALILIGIIFSYIRRKIHKNTWQYKIYQELGEMQKNLNNQSALQILVKLSEILRRLAMYKYSRNKCAGLEGNEWLKFLTKHDEAKFNWQKHGHFLTHTVYAPFAYENIPLQKVNKLINATKKWIN